MDPRRRERLVFLRHSPQPSPKKEGLFYSLLITKEIHFLTYLSGKRNVHHVDEITKAAAALGRLGGLAKSANKTAAVRKNGKKGGRPRGSKNKKKTVTV